MAFYRLIAGKHFGAGPEDCDCDICTFNRREYQKAEKEKKEGRVFAPRLRDHVYQHGDIIESEADLTEFNQPPYSIKFEKVDGSGRPVNQTTRKRKKPSTPVDDIHTGDGLEEMTVDELKFLAEEEEIELKPDSKKVDIIKALRAGMVVQAAEAGFRG